MNDAGTNRTMPQKCPQCGATLPKGGLAGLCPACLMQQGVAADTATRSEAKPFVPPPVEEVARLFPQLEILGFLGKGGMGAVYKARQPALDRLVALKILPAQTAPDPGFAERFTREARALARLSHPNIVAVHEFGQVTQSSAGVPPASPPGVPPGSVSATAEVPTPPPPPALPYFIMEFVDGVNLRQLQRAGRLSPRKALQIVPQICDALQYAHDEGVVHRDIKPENVLIDRKGRVKIADFGLAKIMKGGDGSPRCPADDSQTAEARATGPSVPTYATEAGQVMGTPHYMAPEQIEHPQDVDHRADIYSLGVVFYEMLTGELPLGKFQPPSRRVQVDVRLDEVVLHALEKEPERRYQQASQLSTDVQGITAAPTGAIEPTSSGLRAWKIAAAVILALVAVNFAIVVVTLRPALSKPGLNSNQKTEAPAAWPLMTGVSLETTNSRMVKLLVKAMTIHLDNVPLAGVFDSLQANIGLSIVADKTLPVLKQRVSMQMDGVTLAEVFSYLSQNYGLRFQIGEDMVQVMDLKAAKRAPEETRFYRLHDSVNDRATALASLERATTNLFKGSKYMIDHERNLVVATGTPEQLGVMEAILREVGAISQNEGERTGAVTNVEDFGQPAWRSATQSETPTPLDRSVTHALLTEPPVFRFLAWQDEWQTNQPGAARQPDGSRVTDPVELGWLRQVSPGRSGISGNKPKSEPRFLHLWFSSPPVGRTELNEVSLLDGAGKPIQSGDRGSWFSQPHDPSDRNGNLGWFTTTLSQWDWTNLPSHITVRLTYTIGPLERVQELAITPNRAVSMFLGGGGSVNNYGQNMDGTAFLTITADVLGNRGRRFDAVAVTKEGREIPSKVRGSSAWLGTHGTRRFEFTLPLADVARFLIGMRPLRTNEWRNVVLPGN